MSMSPLLLMIKFAYSGIFIAGIMLIISAVRNGSNRHFEMGIRGILTGLMLGFFMPVFETFLQQPTDNTTLLQLMTLASIESPFYGIFPGLSGGAHLLLVSSVTLILTILIWYYNPGFIKRQPVKRLT